MTVSALSRAVDPLCANRKSARSGLLEQRNGGSREAGDVNIGPDPRGFVDVVPLVHTLGNVKERLEHARLADYARVDVERRICPKQISTAHGAIKGSELFIRGASELTRTKRAAIVNVPGHAVHVQGRYPRVNGVCETALSRRGALS